jgi:hypothetical protein
MQKKDDQTDAQSTMTEESKQEKTHASSVQTRAMKKKASKK